MRQLQQKLTRVSSLLDNWGRETFRNVQQEIRWLNQQLNTMRVEPACLEPLEEETGVTHWLTELYQREEVMWRQQSRVQWLAEGHKNTRFFHLWVSKRKKKNNIIKLTRKDGSVMEVGLKGFAA